MASPCALAARTVAMLSRVERGERLPSPESVEAHTRVEAARVRRLARELCAAPSAVCYGRFGVSTQEFGGLANWLVIVLNVAPEFEDCRRLAEKCNVPVKLVYMAALAAAEPWLRPT